MCHRSDFFCQIVSASDGDQITEESIFRLAVHPEGLFKHSPPKAKRVLILNQTDNEARRQQAKEIARLIHHFKGNTIPVLATSFDPQEYQLIWSEAL